MSASNLSGLSHVIELKDIEKSFQLTGAKTLSGIHLKVSSGEFVFLTGASGSGKTTLLRMIMGMDRPTKGELLVLGHPVHKMSDSSRRALRRDLGIILQDHRLVSTLNISENIELPLIWKGFSSAARKKRVEEILGVMDLSHLGTAQVKTLSGGENSESP